MKKFLLIAALFIQSSALAQTPQPIRLKDAVADFPRNQLQLKTNGPVLLAVDHGERAAYQWLGDLAGLNVIFDPDFRDSAGGPFRIDNVDVLQALDLLSARARSFVEVLNSNTIIVAPDNPTKRRDYEQMILKTFYLPNGASQERLTEIITTLRTTLLARYLFTSPTANAVVMRDTPTRVAAADKIIASVMPLVSGAPTATMGETIPNSGHILTLEGSVVRDSTPSRTTLNVTGKGPVSFDVTDSTRAIFENVARAAGLNIIFDSDFRSDQQSFKVDHLDVLDALDVLALQTRSFWTPVDGKTIVVAPDNQTKQRDLGILSIRTFYLPNASPVEMVEIVTALRTLLNSRYLASIAKSNTIVMRDNANKLALAERIVSDLRKANGVVVTAGFSLGSETGFVLNRRAAQTFSAASLPSQRLSFDANDSVRATYEALAATAGLRIMFDSRFQGDASVSFKIQNVDIVDALDFLSLQSRTIWEMMGRDTVLVMPDNQTARAELLPKVTKTISVAPREGATRDDFVTALRTVLNLRQLSTLDNSIVITDTAENIIFAEKMLKELETSAVR
jgi:hypothetical protein